MLLAVLGLVLVGLLIGSAMCAAVLHVSHGRGWIDAIGAETHKQHDVVVPNTGGVAIFWAVILPMIGIMLAAWAVPPEAWPAELAQHIPGLRSETLAVALLLGSVVIMHVLGLIDDRRRLGPGFKMGVMLATATLLAIAADMRVLSFLDNRYGWLGYLVSVVVSVLWIVTIVNAFNFLDNMDGLSAGVAMILAGLYLIVTLAGGQWFVSGMCALLSGSLLAFLCFNLPPARLFMGDGGSLVVGLLMAVISIRTTYYNPIALDHHRHGVIMPLIMMAVPLYDFVSVTVVRLRRGSSPFRGDQNHFSHRLVRLGLSKQRAVGLIWLCTLATGMSGLVIGWLAQDIALIVGIQALVILAALALLESGVKRP